MLFIGYFKANPTEYVIEHRSGEVRREGAGLSFFYPTWNATLSLVPLNTVDANFVFNETTANYQALTIQGQVTYRIVEPAKIAQMLNFTIEPGSRKYVSDDPEKLARRVVNAIQLHARALISSMALEDALKGSEALAETVLKTVQSDTVIRSMGVDVLSLHVAAVKPTPEMAKALEAEYREALQRKSDEAIYARRAAAVEQERKISENEMASKIALEERRKELVELEGANDQKEADFEAAATATKLAPYQSVDPRMLLAMGFKGLGERAGEIKSLTITPELLSAIRDAR
jgi:hypothetical protein